MGVLLYIFPPTVYGVIVMIGTIMELKMKAELRKSARIAADGPLRYQLK